MTQVQTQTLENTQALRDLLDLDPGERLARLTTKSGPWYTFNSGTFLDDQPKVRGAAAADATIVEALQALIEMESAPEPEPEVKPEPARSRGTRFDDLPAKGSYEEMISSEIEDGMRFRAAHGEVPTASGKAFFKTSQPITVFTCSCGTRRAVHVQDVAMARGRCVECVKREQREARKVQAKAKRLRTL